MICCVYSYTADVSNKWQPAVIRIPMTGITDGGSESLVNSLQHPPLHGPLQTDENSGTVVAVFDLGVLDAQDVVHASQESGT